MLSILIPAYHYDASPLVSEIHRQCLKSGIDFEIICQDDASESESNKENSKINVLSHCHFFVNPKNLGRGQNINSMATKASHKWLLILDCDVFPTRDDFITNYVALIKDSNVKAAFGGIRYQIQKPEKQEMLRWVYGNKREAISHHQRKKNPYQTTLTSNFLIQKSVFLNHLFHNDIHEYGYEDIVFTAGLKSSGIAIDQVENPVFHLNLETSAAYMEKIHTALRNLFYLMNTGLITHTESNIIKTYQSVCRMKLQKLVAYFYRLTQNRFRKQLLSENPRLFVLDLYKIGYFCSLKP